MLTFPPWIVVEKHHRTASPPKPEGNRYKIFAMCNIALNKTACKPSMWPPTRVAFGNTFIHPAVPTGRTGCQSDYWSELPCLQKGRVEPSSYPVVLPSGQMGFDVILFFAARPCGLNQSCRLIRGHCMSLHLDAKRETPPLVFNYKSAES